MRKRRHGLNPGLRNLVLVSFGSPLHRGNLLVLVLSKVPSTGPRRCLESRRHQCLYSYSRVCFLFFSRVFGATLEKESQEIMCVSQTTVLLERSALPCMLVAGLCSFTQLRGSIAGRQLGAGVSTSVPVAECQGKNTTLNWVKLLISCWLC